MSNDRPGKYERFAGDNLLAFEVECYTQILWKAFYQVFKVTV